MQWLMAVLGWGGSHVVFCDLSRVSAANFPLLFSYHDCLPFDQLTVPKVKPGFAPSTTALALASTP